MSSPLPLDEQSVRTFADAAFSAVGAPGKSGVDDISVRLEARRGGYVRWAANQVTASAAILDVAAWITCARGGRHATVNLHGLDPTAAAAAARRAAALAELLPVDPEWVPDVGPTRFDPVAAAWDGAAAALTPTDRGTRVSDAVARAERRKLVGAGILEDEASSEAYVTRRGFFGLHHQTAVRVTTTVRTPDGNGSGWAGASRVRSAELDVAAAIDRAADKAEQNHGARPLDPGVYTVVLEPAAVADLISWLLHHLQQRAADEGRSAFYRPGGTRIGERLFGELTLRTDPRDPLMPASPFDGEGLVRPAVTWIEDGVLRRLRTSRYWARKTHRPADAAPTGAVVSAARVTPPESLIATLERGLVVTRLWYLRMLEPQTLTVTGLTRDGVLLVEKGKVVGPVNNFRLNQSVPAMFAACDAYGPSVRALQSEFWGGTRMGVQAVPAVRCTRFHMASRSDAV